MSLSKKIHVTLGKSRYLTGFTLIELMIVVAIVGILAAVAIPAYQDYSKRAYVSEGLGLASAAKSAVSEYYASEGSFPTSNATAGLETTISGNAVTNIQVGAAGVITITFNSKVNTTKNQLTLTPSSTNGAISWVCAPATTNGVENKYLPSGCRSVPTPP